jgi:aerotaxis receptor
MKNNQPVTQREITLPANTYIVSQTDLKGIITDVNDAFIDTSGFTREELIGKNHNIVRHPDMPQAAFADLWASVKAGLPWRGIVKNRCKSGDHYWVDALIVPIQKNGMTTGYMSVRRAPTRSQVSEAETLYASLRGQNPQITKKPPMALTTLFYLLLAAIGLPLVANLVIMQLALPQWLDMLTGVLALLPLLPLIILMRKRIFLPMEHLQEMLSRMAEGDLSERYPIQRDDEIGHVANALSTMQTRWLVSLDNLQVAIRETYGVIQTVERKASAIDGQINQQHDRISSTAAATEELYQSIAEVANSAAETASAAGSSQSRVGQSQLSMEEGMRAADQVVYSVQHSNTVISELNLAVGKIGDIAQVIKEISDQTNLLALNAAIEAARAGEVGRGFAVVADEVRKLAERTGGSTGEITKTIATIQQLAADVGASMENAADEVSTSTSKIRESGTTLAEVAAASLQTVNMARHIANAADQQKLAGEEIAVNMEQVSHLSEQSQSELNELARSMRGLEQAAAHIKDAVSNFRVF